MEELTTQWGNFFLRCMLFVTHVMVHGAHNEETHKASRYKDQQRLTSDLRLWKIILERSQFREVNAIGFSIIQIQRAVCTVLVNCCTDRTDASYDNFRGEFEFITDLCAYVMDARLVPDTLRFEFNGGNVASALSLVASKCRHYEVRMRAVQLFRKISWREGTWDRGAILCNLGQVDMEERERDSAGNIKPTSRWVWTNTRWQDGKPYAEYTRAIPVDNEA
ncbi:hypothetical protein G7Z17_g6436 [Cylindrodendrum hubeiense]|uniref:Uncharacterized protein n=1 Tax=Cylindrodendrum hubeiense TaxID=595255 RepID=A0A9P5HCB6_9HYPO|nr:hypothetical protein G7Z17_g6436 [Cylindrodendrum hubeiense]